MPSAAPRHVHDLAFADALVDALIEVVHAIDRRIDIHREAAASRNISALPWRKELRAVFSDEIGHTGPHWSAVLPPQLVGRDEAAIRSMLVEQVEQVLRELAAAITAQAQEAAHAD